MKKIVVLIISLLSLSVFSQTEDKSTHPITEQELKCLAKENITNAEMCECVIRSREAWDKELNKYYNLLKSELTKEQFEILKESQKQWVAYRDREFLFISKFYYEIKEGTMWYSIAENQKMEIVRSRAVELTDYYETLDY